MIPNDLTDVTTGGILAILILRTVLPYVTNKMEARNGGKKPSESPSEDSPNYITTCAATDRLSVIETHVDALATNTEKMAEIISKTDSYGAPFVYGSPARLANALDRLGATIETLNTKVDRLQ